jgi:hypothetical protein
MHDSTFGGYGSLWMLACALFVQYGLHLELEHLKEASNEIRDPELKLLRLEVPLSQHLRY